jgi:hypothetical protein
VKATQSNRQVKLRILNAMELSNETINCDVGEALFAWQKISPKRPEGLP